MNAPQKDGQVMRFSGAWGYREFPYVYYVNGIQTTGEAHASTAMLLSEITEHVVHGVYNKTAGMGAVGMLKDIGQCWDDWTSIFGAKIVESAVNRVNAMLTASERRLRRIVDAPPGDPVNIARAVRDAIPLPVRHFFIEHYLAERNLATLSLFRQLRDRQRVPQHIVAHSQGNLIVSNALWAMTLAYGDGSLANIRVYSLASPSPAWPSGLHYKRKVYGHKDDLVTLADPHNWAIVQKLLGKRFGRTPGDWRIHGKTGPFDLAPHDVRKNMALNFFLRIRRELGLPPIDSFPIEQQQPFD